MQEIDNPPSVVSSRTVLITGARGLLGRMAAHSFSRAGWTVVAKGREELDIASPDAVTRGVRAARPDLIINCAAATDVDRCEREPDYATGNNEVGPALLARAADEMAAQIVHISTDYVFDGEKDGFYTQEDVPNPLSVYGRSKLAGEAAVQQATRRHYVVRTSWIFGRGGKNFGSRVVEYAQKNPALKGVIDQTSIPTYAPDLADRLVQIVDRGEYGLYHVTSSGVTTWYEFATEALTLAGLGHINLQRVTRADLKQDAARPHNSAMRCLLSERLGFSPLRHWREALTEFIPGATA